MRSDDPTSSKTERLNVRLSPRRRALLEAASKAEDTTISEFVLTSATRAAETVLADRRVFVLPPDRWEAFLAALAIAVLTLAATLCLPERLSPTRTPV